jgi:hypothetical protein
MPLESAAQFHAVETPVATPAVASFAPEAAVNPGETRRDNRLPGFGGEHGLIFPFVARLLWYATYLSPVKSFNLSPVAADLFVLGCWTTEILLAVSLSWWGHSVAALRVVAYAFFAYRLLDLLLLLGSFLLVGFYRHKTRWPFRRGLTLVVFNSVEILFLYGGLFYLINFDCPIAAEMNRPLDHLIDGVYFSVVTASTLGYGDFQPRGWLIRMMAMSESLFVLLVLLVVIGSFKGVSFRLRDTDES